MKTKRTKYIEPNITEPSLSLSNLISCLSFLKLGIFVFVCVLKGAFLKLFSCCLVEVCSERMTWLSRESISSLIRLHHNDYESILVGGRLTVLRDWRSYLECFSRKLWLIGVCLSLTPTETNRCPIYILQYFLTSFGKIRNQSGRRRGRVSGMGTFDNLTS